MNMPKSGRVVIIDNKFEEALPLIRILSKYRVAVTFFSGRIEDLPPEPFSDVRIVFLDIVLEGLEGADDKTRTSTLVNVISKVVSKENGPFILVIWTKHPEFIQNIQKALKEEGFYFLIVDLEKHKFFESKDGEWLFSEDKIEELNREVENKLKKIDIFGVFVDWENLIHDAASLTVNEISKLAEYDDQWNQEIKKIFFNLAKAWVGKKIDDIDDNEKIRSALFTFNQIFGDVFERELQLIDIENISLDEGNIDNNTRGKINSRIILDRSGTNDVYPGNVYKLEDLPLLEGKIDKKKIVNDIINWKMLKQVYNEKYRDSGITKNRFHQGIKEALCQKAELVYLEITPICDFVQSKMILNRFVLGTIFPVKLSFDIDDRKIELEVIHKREPLIKQQTNFLYISPIFEYKNDFCFIAFDFRYFTSINPEQLKDKKPIFRFRKELLSDIQIKLSSHISRTGVLYLD